MEILLTELGARIEPVCGIRCGRGYIRCELPPDHVVGRNHTPIFEYCHTGRSKGGKWYSWQPRIDDGSGLYRGRF